MPLIKLRSKNPSATELRTRLSFVRTKSPFVVRLGSRTPLNTFRNRIYHSATEINTIDSIENSRDKLKMKACFSAESIKQANWYQFCPNEAGMRYGRLDDVETQITQENLPYPIVVKQVVGYKGHGMVKCENQEELQTWLINHHFHTAGFYVERFHNMAKEYRLHATQERVFLSWRKLRREDATERWFFNSTNCNWVGEEHELFAKPEAWDLMCEHAVRAIRATGLSIGAVDVRCKSNCRTENDFIILETNSAAELGVVGTEAYYTEITKIVKDHDN